LLRKEGRSSSSVRPGLEMISSGSPENSEKSSPGAPDLVRIVLGGPWKRDGRMWELWEDGRSVQKNRGGFSFDGRHILWHDEDNTRTVAAIYVKHHDPARTELHAPKGYQPTPDTIPEGCFIPTPEGVERDCGTCGWDDEDEACPEPCACTWARPSWIPLKLKRKLKPKPSEPKKEKPAEHESPAFAEGDWCWVLDDHGHKGHAVKMTYVGMRSADGACSCGNKVRTDSPHSEIRKIAVSDKVKVVEKPHAGTTLGGGKIGYINEPHDGPSLVNASQKIGFEGLMHVHVAPRMGHGGQHVLMEDIRLVE